MGALVCWAKLSDVPADGHGPHYHVLMGNLGLLGLAGAGVRHCQLSLRQLGAQHVTAKPARQ